MTVNKQDPQKTSGSGTGHSKSFKKRKGVKICLEKFPEIKKPIELLVKNEVEKVEEKVEQREPKDASDQQTRTPESLNVNCSTKIPQLEKRKQEGNEWKTLKKIDYQRLETVLEEVQSLSEATSTRSGSESEGEQITWEVGHGRPKKPWFYNLVSITEHPEVLSGEETQSEEEPEKQQIVKNEQNAERCDKLESVDGHGEPAEKISKKSVILNGMMEILPIFSNDKFVCSRDAISIEECEELDNLEKTLPSSAKFLIDSKTTKDTRTMDIKPFRSTNSVKKGFRDRVTERLESLKEVVGRKFHYTQPFFSDFSGRQSSHFINFLLVLTPFAEERQKFLQENQLSEGDGVACTGSISEKNRVLQSEGFTILRVIYSLILTTFGVLSVVLGIAWRSYEPPGALDFFLSFIPFIHPRRTYLQILYDKFTEILTTVFGGLCRRLVLPY